MYNIMKVKELDLTEESKSIFIRMHEGTLTGQGSFYVALKELFYKADEKNAKKLIKAFPEFFGDEVPEFGIRKKEVTPTDQLREAHEYACKTYNYISELLEIYKENPGLFDEGIEEKIEEMTEIADELQAKLYDLFLNPE